MKGFTLLEVIFALAILTIVALGLLSSLLSLDLLREQTRERDLASAAAQARLDSLRAEGDFRGLLARIRRDPGFQVPGLRGAGRVVVPSPLREDLDEPSFGLPRDLNLDGRIDGGDRSGDYRLIPVKIRIEWRGTGGSRLLEIVTVLNGRS